MGVMEEAIEQIENIGVVSREKWTAQCFVDRCLAEAYFLGKFSQF
jgi:hypothetical protein